jgi:hypothetical protein
MARIEAVECDLKSCSRLAAPAEGAEIPFGWLMAEYYQEGEGSMNPRTFCSWDCASQWAAGRVVNPVRRKRRTRAEMMADAAASRVAPSDS